MNFDYDAYVPIPELPAEFFAVPDGYEKLQPKSRSAFVKYGIEHPAEIRRVEVLQMNEAGPVSEADSRTDR